MLHFRRAKCVRQAPEALLLGTEQSLGTWHASFLLQNNIVLYDLDGEVWAGMDIVAGLASA
jgi:hypothetical protein